MRQRLYAGMLAAVMTVGGLGVAAGPARAESSKEKIFRIGTYLGTAGTIAALAKGEGTWALVGGGATLLSYTLWRKEVKKRHERDDSRRRYQAYRTAWLKKHKGKRIVRVR